MYKNTQSATVLFALALVAIPTTLFHADVTMAKGIIAATVLVMLFAVWSGLRRIDRSNTAFASTLSKEQHREFAKIQAQFGMVSSIAIGAIMLAVAAGKIIGTVHHD